MKKLIGIICIMIIALLSIGMISLAVGSNPIEISDVMYALMHREAENFASLVVWERVPRTIFCFLVGGALGVSGLLMQSITRNPIADPSILGINSGASLFVVCGIAFFHITTSGQYILFAVLGAVITAVFVYGVGSLGQGGATPLKLVLSGSAVSTAMTALVSVIIMPRTNVMDTFRFWQIGSVSGANWSNIITLLPIFILSIVVALVMSSGLDVLAMGDEAATGLGAKPGVIRLVAAAIGVVLCGATTAFAGPIGFIGLMIPHIIHLLFKANMRSSIVLSSLAGAFLLTISDILGRVIGNPGEVEVGIITAFIGAPVFIIIAIKSKG